MLYSISSPSFTSLSLILKMLAPPLSFVRVISGRTTMPKSSDSILIMTLTQTTLNRACSEPKTDEVKSKVATITTIVSINIQLESESNPQSKLVETEPPLKPRPMKVCLRHHLQRTCSDRFCDLFGITIYLPWIHVADLLTSFVMPSLFKLTRTSPFKRERTQAEWVSLHNQLMPEKPTCNYCKEYVSQLRFIYCYSLIWDNQFLIDFIFTRIWVWIGLRFYFYLG